MDIPTDSVLSVWTADGPSYPNLQGLSIHLPEKPGIYTLKRFPGVKRLGIIGNIPEGVTLDLSAHPVPNWELDLNNCVILGEIRMPVGQPLAKLKIRGVHLSSDAICAAVLTALDLELHIYGETGLRLFLEKLCSPSPTSVKSAAAGPASPETPNSIFALDNVRRLNLRIFEIRPTLQFGRFRALQHLMLRGVKPTLNADDFPGLETLSIDESREVTLKGDFESLLELNLNGALLTEDSVFTTPKLLKLDWGYAPNLGKITVDRSKLLSAKGDPPNHPTAAA